MTQLLAIETSTEACSVALRKDDTVISRYQVIPRLHAKRLLPMVDEVIQEAGTTLSQLDAVAFTAGPGSFTGLRIACSVAQGIAMGADIGVLPVSTLATLALGAYRQLGLPFLAVLLDARMKEVYSGCYQIENELPVLIGQEQLSLPEVVPALPDCTASWAGIGSGWQLSAELPANWAALQLRYPESLPHALDTASIAMCDLVAGRVLAPEAALPVYMRGATAWKTLDQQGPRI